MGTDFFPSPASITADLQGAQEERMRQHGWYTDHVRAGDAALAEADRTLRDLIGLRDRGSTITDSDLISVTALMSACAAIAQAHYAAPFGWAPSEEGTSSS